MIKILLKIIAILLILTGGIFPAGTQSSAGNIYARQSAMGHQRCGHHAYWSRVILVCEP